MAVILFIILFLVWFYRAYKNLHIAKVSPKYAPGWTIGGFFILFLNLWLPFVMFQEIWTKTQRVGLNKMQTEYMTRSSALINVL